MKKRTLKGTREANTMMALVIVTTAHLTGPHALADFIFSTKGEGTVSDVQSHTYTVFGDGSYDSDFNFVPEEGTLNVINGGILTTSELIAGYQGVGILNVNGGTINVTGHSAIGYLYNGTATVSSGSWATGGNLYIGGTSPGYDSPGVLNISGGTVTVSGDLTRNSASTINLNTGGTLQIGTGGTTGTLLGGTGDLENNGTLIFNRSDVNTHSGVISGTGSFTQGGTGTLTLTGANTYSGGTTISAGTLSVGSGSDTGSIAGNVTNNSILAFNRSDALTYGGVISGTGAVTKSGAGTLTLSGDNSYTGETTVSTGVLNIQNANALGTIDAGTSVTSGAALQIQGGITTLAEALTLNGTGVSADGALRNISGENTYAGLVTLGAATRINSDAGTLTLSNAGTITGAGLGLTVGGAGNTTISSIIGTTSGTLTKDGTGTLTLTKTNTFSGGLTMGDSAGSVIAYTNSGTNVSALGTGPVAIGSGSTLELRSQNAASTATTINNTFTGTGLLKLSSSSTGGNNNYLGGINGFSGTVELAYTGTHNNILTGSSAARTSVINAPNATLQINKGNTVYVGFFGSQTWKDIKVSGSGNNENFGAIRFDSGSTLTVTGSVSLLGDTTIGTGGGTLNGAITSGAGGTQTLTLGTSKTTTGFVTLSGAIGGGIGSIALNKTQGNLVILSGANTYTGATTVSGGILNIRHANALGTTAAGTTVNSGATLQIHGNITTAEEPLTLNGTGASNNGALRNFNGNNTYAGLVTLGATTRINSDTGTNLTLSNTGTITGDTFGLTVGGAGNTTIASIIGTTSGTLTKDGTGTLILSGANTFTGATTVSTGVLNIQNASALGTTAAGTSVTSGAALQIQGGITTAAEALTLNGSGVSTDGALRNISGDNTYAGLVTLGAATRINSDAGTLTLNNVGTITGSGLGLTVGGSGNTTIASIIGTTSGTLTKDGAGTLTLSGANTYTGPTTISAGTLEVSGTTGALSATSAVNINGGTLLLKGSAANRISDTEAISLGAAGSKLQLSGAVTETLGALTLAGGAGARVIDFGATIGDSGVLTFASLTGDSSLPLQIWNWSGTIGTGGGTDRFIISNGPAPSNVSFFNGPGTGLYSGATVFTASNELVPVPEASTLLGVLGLMAPLAWRERRHWMRCREARR